MSVTVGKREGSLPEGWQWVRLGQVARVFAGSAAPQGTVMFDPGGQPFVRVSDLASGAVGTRLLSTRDHLANVAISSCSITRAASGTILFPKSGAAVSTNRRVILGVDAYIVSHLMAVEPNEHALSEWLYFVLSRIDMKQFSDNAAYPSLKQSTVANITIPLPPLPEQRRIAAILTEQMAATDKARAALQAQIEAAKALPGAYLREVFPKPEEPLPEGWRWVRLGEVCILNPRRPSLERAAAAPTTFLPMPAIAEKGRGIIAAETRPYGAVARGYTYFAGGDVLFAKITPCMQNGKHAIARDLQDGIGFGSTEFHVLRPSAILTSEWLLSFLLQPWVLHEAATRFTGAVGQQRVPADFLAELVLPLPPLPEQRRIAAMLTDQMAGADRLVHAIDEGSAALDCLPSTLLAQAFGGGL